MVMSTDKLEIINETHRSLYKFSYKNILSIRVSLKCLVSNIFEMMHLQFHCIQNDLNSLMRNTWYHRFQFFDMNMILCKTQFSDTQMVYNSMLNLCYVVSAKFVHVGSVTTIKIFANRRIVLKQTNGKLNWFNDFNNPSEKQFRYIFCVSNYRKHQTIYTQTHLHSFFIRNCTILQWKNINR